MPERYLDNAVHSYFPTASVTLPAFPPPTHPHFLLTFSPSPPSPLSHLSPPFLLSLPHSSPCRLWVIGGPGPVSLFGDQVLHILLATATQEILG